MIAAAGTVRMVDNRGVPPPSGIPETAPESPPVPRVVLADDDVLLREGLASLLDHSGFDVVGQAGNGTNCSPWSVRPSQSWPSSTSGCRLRAPLRACMRRG